MLHYACIFYPCFEKFMEVGAEDSDISAAAVIFLFTRVPTYFAVSQIRESPQE